MANKFTDNPDHKKALEEVQQKLAKAPESWDSFQYDDYAERLLCAMMKNLGAKQTGRSMAPAMNGGDLHHFELEGKPVFVMGDRVYDENPLKDWAPSC